MVAISLVCRLVMGAMPVACGAAPAPPEARTWVGHQVMLGSTVLPVFGDVETRTDARLLVSVTETADGMQWVQRTCEVAMSKVAGVQSGLPQATLAKLPSERIAFTRAADGSFRSTYRTVWSAADLDGDGHPGVSIEVDVPLCSGQVYVTTDTDTRMQVTRVGETLLGELQVETRQEVLGASNWCLRLGPKKQVQAYDGVLVLVPAPGVSNCDDMDDAGWPVAMGE